MAEVLWFDVIWISILIVVVGYQFGWTAGWEAREKEAKRRTTPPTGVAQPK
jgi:hypothetical protein